MTTHVRELTADERALLARGVDWPRIVRERCDWCDGRGRVEVRDGTPFPALALCAACAGQGFITRETTC